jgi:excinuclease UvrABC nuclease subunit
MNYQGFFTYSSDSIWWSAPDLAGVYLLGHFNFLNRFTIDYAGMSSVSIRDRVLRHYQEENWPEITHFAYRLCASEYEALTLEASAINQWQPKRNKAGK